MNDETRVGAIGYTRSEFRRLLGIYSKYVYGGFFRDFSFSEHQGRYFISFREDCTQIPVVTIEKRRLGPDRVLFIATTPAGKGHIMPIARSEKIDHFVEQLTAAIDTLRLSRETLSSTGR